MAIVLVAGVALYLTPGVDLSEFVPRALRDKAPTIGLGTLLDTPQKEAEYWIERNMIKKWSEREIVNYYAVSAIGARRGDAVAKKLQSYLEQNMAPRMVAQAEAMAGAFYYTGNGWDFFAKKSVARDDREAFYWLSRAAGKGDETSQLRLGEMYLEGRGVGTDYRKAFEFLKPLAEGGNIEAGRQMVRMHLHGMGLPRNTREAEAWAKRLVEQGDEQAKSMLAAVEKVLERERDEAILRMQEALRKAQAGDAAAQEIIGFAYLDGTAIKQDATQAFHWLLKAARAGLVKAQAQVAAMFYEGVGTERDPQQAVAWWKRAAAAGDEESRKRLKQAEAETLPPLPDDMPSDTEMPAPSAADVQPKEPEPH